MAVASRANQLAAQQWLDETIARARELVQEQPLGPRDQPWEKFEATTRGMVAASLRPTDGYLGLTVEDARARARELNDFLCTNDAGRSTS